jgi:hypothetical protein
MKGAIPEEEEEALKPAIDGASLVKSRVTLKGLAQSKVWLNPRFSSAAE